MKPIKLVLDKLADLGAIVAGAAVVLMMLHVATDISLRYLFDAPLTGTITFVSNYYMVAVVCLPLAFVERMDAHIAVDFVTDQLSLGLAYHIRHLALIPAVLVSSLVTYSTWVEAMGKFRLKTFIMEHGMQIPTWFGYFALPIGYGLMTLYLGLKFASYVTGSPIAPYKPDSDGLRPDVAHD